MSVGFLLLAIGIATVGAGLLFSLPFVLVPLGWALAGGGVGLAFTAGGLICIREAAPGREGEVSGQLQLLEALGTATGAGVGGAVIAALVPYAGSSLRLAYAPVFGLTLTAAILGLVLSRRL